MSYTGEVGTGEAVKLAHNLMATAMMVGIAEALVLATKAGVDPDTPFSVLTASAGNSPLLEKVMGPTILARNFEPRMRVELQCKDVALALALGAECGVPLHVGAAAQQVFIQAKAAGLGDKDFGAVILPIEELAGVKVQSGKQ